MGKGDLKGNESAKGQGFDKNPQNINRKGGPKGFKGLTETLRDIVNADGSMVIQDVKEVDDNGTETGNVFKNGKISIPKSEMIILAALKKAAKGDMKAIMWLFDRLDGKAEQSIKMTDNRVIKTEIDIRDKTPEEIAAIKKALTGED